MQLKPPLRMSTQIVRSSCLRVSPTFLNLERIEIQGQDYVTLESLFKLRECSERFAISVRNFVFVEINSKES